MSSQIFKKNIPNEVICHLLDEICFKNENRYTFNNDSFKKGIFNGSILKFIKECEPYYHLSKRKYLNRKMNYNSFTTIIRQICNFNKIIYESQIKYDKSSYCIVYYITF
jgi:hypothetical protein